MESVRHEHGVVPAGHRRRLAVLLLLGGLALVLLACVPAAVAGPRQIIFDFAATPSWTGSIAGVGAGVDEARDIVLLPGDTSLVAGTLSNAAGNADMSLSKYRGDVLQWTKSYDGPAHANDVTEEMALSPDGKAVYIAGSSYAASGKPDIVVVKRSAKSGKLIWAKRYDGPAHEDDWAEAIGVDPSGNVVVAGLSAHTTTDDDGVVVSWTAKGARRWVWRYAGSAHEDDGLIGLVVTQDGSTFVTGVAIIAGPKEAALNARLSSAGKKLWLKTYLGPDDLGAVTVSLVPRPGGGVYAGGMAVRTTTSLDGMILRYSAKGSRTVVALDTGLGAASVEMFNDVAVASTKAIVAVGMTTSGGTSDARVAVYRTDGTVVGAVTVPGLWDDGFTDVATDAFGGFYAVGTHHVGAGDRKIATWRGSVLTGGGGFASVWGGPVASESNRPATVAVRDTTAFVVGMYASGAATGNDQFVLRYTY